MLSPPPSPPSPPIPPSPPAQPSPPQPPIDLLGGAPALAPLSGTGASYVYEPLPAGAMLLNASQLAAMEQRLFVAEAPVG